MMGVKEKATHFIEIWAISLGINSLNFWGVAIPESPKNHQLPSSATNFESSACLAWNSLNKLEAFAISPVPLSNCCSILEFTVQHEANDMASFLEAFFVQKRPPKRLPREPLLQEVKMWRWRWSFPHVSHFFVGVWVTETNPPDQLVPSIVSWLVV